MIDLIKRLRSMAAIGWNPIGDEAADVIEQLQAKNECLVECLKIYADKENYYHCGLLTHTDDHGSRARKVLEAVREYKEE